MDKEMIKIINNRLNAFAASVSYKCPACRKNGIITDYNPYVDDENNYHIHCEQCGFEPILDEHGQYIMP